MTKISWTCTRCGVWHSATGDAGHTERCTYDGLPTAKTAIERLGWHMSTHVSPEVLVRITSIPMDMILPYDNPSVKIAKEPRRMILDVVAGQPFRLFCLACGHDSTDEMKPSPPKAMMVSIDMVPK